MKPSLFEIYDYFAEKLHPLGQVYICGGSVRDHLMFREPKDFDIFILNQDVESQSEANQAAMNALANGINFGKISTSEPSLDWHKSEPFLLGNFKYHYAENQTFKGGATSAKSSVDIQILLSPCKSIVELVESFDYNVSMFSYGEGVFYNRENVQNIAPGGILKLNKITFPYSTLRRGYRFSERFMMEFKQEDILKIIEEINKLESKK